MRNSFFGLLAAAILPSGMAGAVEPPATAPDRAALYQHEVRAALTARGWGITQDEAGKLVAERLKVDSDGTTGIRVAGSLNSYAHLEIDFRADRRNPAVSAAYASLRIYGPLNKSYLLYPPLALRDPKLTREYHDIMAEAQAHLAAAHSDKIALR